MKVIAIILLVILAVLSDRKNKKKAKKRIRPADPQVRQAPKPKPELHTEGEDPAEHAAHVAAMHAADQETDARTARASAQFDMPYDGEGETPQEHQTHLDAMKQAEAAETQSEQTQSAAYSARIAQLRSAIVLTEILDKPVSLRDGR